MLSGFVITAANVSITWNMNNGEPQASPLLSAVRPLRVEVLLPEMAPAKWTIAAPAEHQRFHDLARARCNITLCEREIQKYIPVFSTILFCISLFYLFGKCNLPFFYNSNSRKNYSILKTILLFKFIISWIPSREVSRKLTAKTNCP